MKYAALLILIAFTLQANAARFEQTDIRGRLFLVDQATGTTQAMLTTTRGPESAGLAGDLKGLVDGQKVDTFCSGFFIDNIQTIELTCDDYKKALVIKLQNDKVSLISFLNGSFGTATISYVDRPLTSPAKTIIVDLKNLDLR